MKPETTAFMAKAQEFLAKSRDLLDAHRWPDEAGRASYLAGFHAAQAFIFEHTDNVLKTHRGVQIEFLRMTKANPGFDAELRAFLGRSYSLKAIADYDIRATSTISAEAAARAIQTSQRFVIAVGDMLATKS